MLKIVRQSKNGIIILCSIMPFSLAFSFKFEINKFLQVKYVFAPNDGRIFALIVCILNPLDALFTPIALETLSVRIFSNRSKRDTTVHYAHIDLMRKWRSDGIIRFLFNHKVQVCLDVTIPIHACTVLKTPRSV